MLGKTGTPIVSFRTGYNISGGNWELFDLTNLRANLLVGPRVFWVIVDGAF